MSRLCAENFLPVAILSRASLRGNEYAWRVDDIPNVIEAARNVGLLNIGGQLQFKFSDATCECHWVQVNTYNDVANDLPWDERVAFSAKSALAQFEELRGDHNFVAEGRAGFAKALAAEEVAGRAIQDAMWFVWYVASEAGASSLPG